MRGVPKEPIALVPLFNEVLRRRLEQEQKLSTPEKPFWPWFSAAAAALLAVFVVVGIGGQHRRPAGGDDEFVVISERSSLR